MGIERLPGISRFDWRRRCEMQCKSWFRRLAEFLIVIIIVAAICAIAVPLAARSLSRARTVAAQSNWAEAEQALSLSLMDNPYRLDVSGLNEDYPGIKWVEYRGQALPEFKTLSKDQICSVYLYQTGDRSFCSFALVSREKIRYSLYSNGEWRRSGTVKYQAGKPARLLTGSGGA
jgi:type II secretory pathway pseudopilin PulG